MPGAPQVLVLVSWPGDSSSSLGIARTGQAVLLLSAGGHSGSFRQEGAGPGKALSLPQPGREVIQRPEAAGRDADTLSRCGALAIKMIN